MIKKTLGHIYLLAAIFIVTLPFATSASAEPLQEIRELITTHYVDDVPEQVLSRGTAKDITAGLDAYSVYMTKKEYDTFINGIEQRIVGIGIVLEESSDGVKVISVIKDGPASKAGILPGDIVTHANGTPLKGKSVQAAIPFISGDEQTVVTLVIRRESDGGPVTLTKKIVRAEIHLPTVETEMLGGNIGYIRLNSFAADSGKEMLRAIEQLDGAEGFIVDIRSNGGGYITAAQDVSGFFPGITQAFQLREKNKKPSIYPSVDQKKKIEGPVSLLINEFSASASEMVAVNLKERGAATLYGQNTYGKGTMQTMYAFSDGSVLKLTTARFYSPSGIAVNGIGVSPDVITDKDKELTTAHYEQLLAQVKGYKELPALIGVKPSKTFTVEMTKEMDWNNFDKSAIQLVEIGGKEIAVDVLVIDGSSIKIIPESPLDAGKSYFLVIHPNWKDYNGARVKNGIYLNVTVK